MLTNPLRTLLAITLLATTAAAASAQPAGPGSFSVTLKAAWDPTTGGVMHEGGSGTVLGLPTSVDEKPWSDTHNQGFRLDAGIGFGVSERAEIVASFNYGTLGSELLQVGTVAGLPLLAKFEDYEYWGLEGGARFFLAQGGVTPYITAVAGFRRVSELPGTFSVPQAGVTLADTPFFESSTVPTFGADFGVLFGPIGVEGGFRYAGGLTDDDSGFAGTGLENLNDKGERWSFPISVVVRF